MMPRAFHLRNISQVYLVLVKATRANKIFKFVRATSGLIIAKMLIVLIDSNDILS